MSRRTQIFFSQSANPRAYVPPVTHRHSPYIHASTAGPPTQAPVPRPSTSAHVNGQLATHSSSQSSSSLSSLSRPTSSCTPDSAALGPKDKGKKRRATADIEDDDEIQEIPAIEYRASNSKGKRVKHRPN
ncbi:hypothetical protein OPQ81_008153 [Rhizoctonia solani]|nr:hypothetical protein OPQ81_008153 [Rhizoctonia solani]